MAFSSTIQNIPPPLIKNTSRNTTDPEPVDCSLFPGDPSCSHNANSTAVNTTKTAPQQNNTSIPSIKITSPVNGQKIPINNTAPPTATNNTQSTNTTMPIMNMTAATPTPTTNSTTQAHQCPDGSYADANASCVT